MLINAGSFTQIRKSLNYKISTDFLLSRKKQYLQILHDQQVKKHSQQEFIKELKNEKYQLNQLEQSSKQIQAQLKKTLKQKTKIKNKVNTIKSQRQTLLNQIQISCQQLQDKYLSFDTSQQKSNDYESYQQLYFNILQRQSDINNLINQLKQNSIDLITDQNNKKQFNLTKLLVKFCSKNDVPGKLVINHSVNNQNDIFSTRRHQRIKQWQQIWFNNNNDVQQQDISYNVLQQLQMSRDIQSYPLFEKEQNQIVINQQKNLYGQKNKKLCNQLYLYSFIIQNNLIDDFRDYLKNEMQMMFDTMSVDQQNRNNIHTKIQALINDLSKLKHMYRKQKQGSKANSKYFGNNHHKQYNQILNKLVSNKLVYNTKKNNNKQSLQNISALRHNINSLTQQQSRVQQNIMSKNLIVQRLQRKLKQSLRKDQILLLSKRAITMNDIDQIQQALIYLKSNNISDKYYSSDNNLFQKQNNSLITNNIRQQTQMIINFGQSQNKTQLQQEQQQTSDTSIMLQRRSKSKKNKQQPLSTNTIITQRQKITQNNRTLRKIKSSQCFKPSQQQTTLKLNSNQNSNDQHMRRVDNKSVIKRFNSSSNLIQKNKNKSSNILIKSPSLSILNSPKISSFELANNCKSFQKKLPQSNKKILQRSIYKHSTNNTFKSIPSSTIAKSTSSIITKSTSSLMTKSTLTTYNKINTSLHQLKLKNINSKLRLL